MVQLLRRASNAQSDVVVTNQPKSVQQLETRFQLSNLCRTMHIDGAMGGVTPTLNVHMSVYSEHRAPPSGSTVRIQQDGTAEDKLNADPLYLVREIEAHMIFSEATATAL